MTNPTTTLTAASFRTALRLVAPAAQSRASLAPPVPLQLHEYNGVTAIHAADDDLEITAAIADTIPIPCPMLLPAHAIHRLFAFPPAAALTFTYDHKTESLTVDLGALQAAFPVEPVPIPEMLATYDPAQSIRIERKTLLNALELTGHCIGTEEMRYFLNGLSIDVPAADPTGLAFCATDGHRLCKRVVTGLSHSLGAGIIIPRHAVQALRNLLSHYTTAEEIDLVACGAKLLAKSASWRLACKLIDGTFPDYNSVIPQDAPLIATFPAAPLRAFCSACASVGEGHAPSIELAFSAAEKTVTARWVSVDLGTLRTRFAAAVDRDLTIGFQHRYLAHALDALKSETVSLQAHDMRAPAILAAAGELTDPSTTIVIMPMRI